MPALVTSPERAYEEVIEGLAQRLNLSRRSANALRFYAHRHPASPSLASLRWALGKMGVRSAVCGMARAEELPTRLPCVVQCEMGDDVFLFLTKRVEGGEIELFHQGADADKDYTVSFGSFMEKYRGVALIADGEAKASVYRDDPLWRGHCRQHHLQIVFAVVVLVAFGAVQVLTYIVHGDWYRLVLQALAIIGIFLAVLLIRRYWGVRDRLASRLCGFGGKKFECTSRGAMPLPWGLDLPEVSMAYFVFLFVLAAVGGASYLLGVVCIAGVLFVPLSLVYQWRKQKSWCMLCLAVDVALCLLGVAGVLMLNGGESSTGYGLLRSTVALGVGMTVGYLARRVAELSSLYLQEKRLFALAKYKAFTAGQTDAFRKIARPEGNQAIRGGAEEADWNVVLVLSPTCSACRQYAEYMGLAFERKYNAGLSVVTMPRFGVKNIQAAAFFLRECQSKGLLAALRGSKTLHSAGAPINAAEEGGMLAAHRAWCEINGIHATPTLCVNGKVLPLDYTAEDVDFLCV